MSKKITFIFDFDGTVADTLPILINDVYKINDELKLIEAEDVDIEDIRKKSTEQFLKDLNLGPIKLVRFIIKFRKLFNEHLDDVPVTRDLKPVLEKLNQSNIYLGIVTSNSKSNVKRILKANKLSMFSFVDSSFWFFKKDKLLVKAIKKHTLNSEYTYYIGDETRDVRAAKDAGLKMISVTWGIGMEPILKRFQPDYIIDRPQELLEILENLN